MYIKVLYLSFLSEVNGHYEYKILPNMFANQNSLNKTTMFISQ